MTDQSGAVPETLREAANAIRKMGTALVNHIGNMNSNAGRPDRPDADELPTAVEWLTELDSRADSLTAALMAYSFAEHAALERPRPAPPEPSKGALHAAWEVWNTPSAQSLRFDKFHDALRAAYAADFGGTAGTDMRPQYSRKNGRTCEL